MNDQPYIERMDASLSEEYQEWLLQRYPEVVFNRDRLVQAVEDEFELEQFLQERSLSSSK